ncbi:hydroxyacylglutathione hydrolase [Thalassomonas sp. M1454]|uniref:hydroxyacylglutathione hydrolase n=1 Tax=Thalassomonas sp. M1454 TaxID=2594477 RepID=UPI00117F320B|nr:hydroxyacylglutathione hydrolase [Thalassomonas sp. M1454]TRX56745.1 hydroxyacylglutathione hydrolase [Thalassomonas sp. M1454]
MFEIKAIHAFSDNFIWCIINTSNSHCVLVDPGDANVCIDFIEQNNLHLTDILITHHHSDHVGGLAQLLEFAKANGSAITIYGPATENIKLLDQKLVQDDVISLFDSALSFSVIDLPGHTSGHIAYYCACLNNSTDKDDVLFCGDTLFSGGCGRLFEGTAAQMLNSLTKLSNLPEHTKVYCAHEYTLANLHFARTIEPKNSQLQSYYEKVVDLRAKDIATIPSTIGLEKQINPFLRSHCSSIKQVAEQQSTQLLETDVKVFAIIRSLKDNF